MGGDPTLILSLVRWARIGSSRLAGDDDHIDRLNYQITSLLLLLLVALTGMRQYLCKCVPNFMVVCSKNFIFYFHDQLTF
ncbi:uncharacterized protein DEA37_0013114 [Paragonimus westermani]|uniref:Uncharacterized protein n=1 Tax=Paragonimus westermani TaxID=34504 RepID=A0A5J4NKR0_9TREM|nr:uncharacterized protein DEA37_0013114 [Paragonimus westermani]